MLSAATSVLPYIEKKKLERDDSNDVIEFEWISMLAKKKSRQPTAGAY
jgi:hypothetical protein